MRFQSRLTARGPPYRPRARWERQWRGCRFVAVSADAPAADVTYHAPRHAICRSIDPKPKRFDDGLPENDRVGENFAKALYVRLWGTLKAHLSKHLPVVRRVQQRARCVGNLLDDRLWGIGRSKQPIGRWIGKSRKTGLDNRRKVRRCKQWPCAGDRKYS